MPGGLQREPLMEQNVMRTKPNIAPCSMQSSADHHHHLNIWGRFEGYVCVCLCYLKKHCHCTMQSSDDHHHHLKGRFRSYLSVCKDVTLLIISFWNYLTNIAILQWNHLLIITISLIWYSNVQWCFNVFIIWHHITL